MTTGLIDIPPDGDPPLTGTESRLMRAALHLERRHVAVLAEIALGRDTTAERVTEWERSKGRGYPREVLVLLAQIGLAVEGLAASLAHDALATGPGVVRRPRGHDRITALLDLPAQLGRAFTPTELRALDEGSGDFWQRLCDAAVLGALRALKSRGVWPARVVLDAGGGPSA